MKSRLVVVYLLACPTLVTPWTVARQAPLSVGSPGKNTAVGYRFLLQNSRLNRWKWTDGC